MVRAMAARYYDADVMITLAALTLASGAFAAVGVVGARRRKDIAPDTGYEAWRGEVMAALEADLTHFAQGFRRAA